MSNSDADYTTRWCLIKTRFSKGIDKTEYIHPTRLKRKERGIWQRRYWPYSTFHRYVEKGVYLKDLAYGANIELDYDD